LIGGRIFSKALFRELGGHMSEGGKKWARGQQKTIEEGYLRLQRRRRHKELQMSEMGSHDCGAGSYTTL
jgi:hypothetical protein